MLLKINFGEETPNTVFKNYVIATENCEWYCKSNRQCHMDCFESIRYITLQNQIIPPHKGKINRTMDETTPAIIPMEVLISMGEEGLLLPFNSKTVAILRSVSSIVSVIASSVLIWMILRSKKRLTAPYHRILLGMSVFDILYGISNSHFNALIPNDLGYVVWNARGNLASCISVGFLSVIGVFGSCFYAISLNIFFLLAVKYNKKDKEINSKYEKWLHGLPIGTVLVIAIAMVSNKNMNADVLGTCQQTLYSPPHCVGFEKGDIREGFKIPCYRGQLGPAGTKAYHASGYIINFGVPVIILATLTILYVFVKKQENKMTGYGAGALDIATPQPSVENPRSSSRFTSITSSMRSSISSLLRSRKSSASSKIKKSRSFLTRGILFSCAYFLTWTWAIIINIWSLATDYTGIPPASIIYLFSFFQQFQGVSHYLFSGVSKWYFLSHELTLMIANTPI